MQLHYFPADSLWHKPLNFSLCTTWAAGSRGRSWGSRQQGVYITAELFSVVRPCPPLASGPVELGWPGCLFSAAFPSVLYTTSVYPPSCGEFALGYDLLNIRHRGSSSKSHVCYIHGFFFRRILSAAQWAHFTISLTWLVIVLDITPRSPKARKYCDTTCYLHRS